MNQCENEERETEGCQVVPPVTRSPASVAVSGQCSRVYVRSSPFGLKTIGGRMLNKGKEFIIKNAKASLNSCWNPTQSVLHEKHRRLAHIPSCRGPTVKRHQTSSVTRRPSPFGDATAGEPFWCRCCVAWLNGRCWRVRPILINEQAVLKVEEAPRGSQFCEGRIHFRAGG